MNKFLIFLIWNFTITHLIMSWCQWHAGSRWWFDEEQDLDGVLKMSAKPGPAGGGTGGEGTWSWSSSWSLIFIMILKSKWSSPYTLLVDRLICIFYFLCMKTWSVLVPSIFFSNIPVLSWVWIFDGVQDGEDSDEGDDDDHLQEEMEDSVRKQFAEIFFDIYTLWRIFV